MVKVASNQGICANTPTTAQTAAPQQSNIPEPVFKSVKDLLTYSANRHMTASEALNKWFRDNPSTYGSMGLVRGAVWFREMIAFLESPQGTAWLKEDINGISNIQDFFHYLDAILNSFK